MGNQSRGKVTAGSRVRNENNRPMKSRQWSIYIISYNFYRICEIKKCMGMMLTVQKSSAYVREFLLLLLWYILLSRRKENIIIIFYLIINRTNINILFFFFFWNTKQRNFFFFFFGFVRTFIHIYTNLFRFIFHSHVNGKSIILSINRFYLNKVRYT